MYLFFDKTWNILSFPLSFFHSSSSLSLTFSLRGNESEWEKENVLVTKIGAKNLFFASNTKEKEKRETEEYVVQERVISGERIFDRNIFTSCSHPFSPFFLFSFSFLSLSFLSFSFFSKNVLSLFLEYFFLCTSFTRFDFLLPIHLLLS